MECGDKSCDHGGGRRVGTTCPGTVCSMSSSPVHHNSRYHHTQQHYKIHGLVQVPSATEPGYVLSYHIQCNPSANSRIHCTAQSPCHVQMHRCFSPVCSEKSNGPSRAQSLWHANLHSDFCQEKKKEKGEGGEKRKQPLQMPHNCTEQMNINVTVKLK